MAIEKSVSNNFDPLSSIVFDCRLFGVVMLTTKAQASKVDAGEDSGQNLDLYEHVSMCVQIRLFAHMR